MDEVSCVFVVFCIIAIALFSVWAWKLWHGQWLNSIAGNTFATKEELELPYQKRMAKEVAVLLVICNLMFAFMAYEFLFGFERGFYRAAMGGFAALILAGTIAVALRASRGTREAKAEIGRTMPAKPRQRWHVRRQGDIPPGGHARAALGLRSDRGARQLRPYKGLERQSQRQRSVRLHKLTCTAVLIPVASQARFL